jgi:hypothetical protein
MIPAAAVFIVRAVLFTAGTGLIIAGIVWLDRDISRGIRRRR